MSSKFVFVGNRRFVLEEMIASEVNLVKVFVVAGTHLERDILNGAFNDTIDYTVFSNKQELLNLLNSHEVDVLISNGCPYILPIKQLPSAKYVNIHPSYLPDLRGVDPVIGSILHARDGGASCHIMDEGIDTGDIISQVKIPYTEDLDVVTMYQLSFEAEKQVFRKALARDFEIAHAQKKAENIIEYARSPQDWMIDFSDSCELIGRKIRAFNNSAQGAEFIYNGECYKVFSLQVMVNKYLRSVVLDMPEGQVAMSYENSIVFHKQGTVLRFQNVIPPPDKSQIPVGAKLF